VKLENATAMHRWALSTVATLAFIIVATVILVPPGGVQGAPLDGVVAPSCPEPGTDHVPDPRAPVPPTEPLHLGRTVSWQPSVDEIDGYLVCVRHGEEVTFGPLPFVLEPEETSFVIPEGIPDGSFLEVTLFAFNEHGLSERVIGALLIAHDDVVTPTPELPVDEATPVVAPPDTGTGAADASRGAATWVLALAAVVAALGGAGALALRRARA
jgi:hypothetical protein